MDFTAFVEAALKLGVIPAIAIFLIFGLFLQNRRLLADQRRLLEKFAEVVLRAQVLQGQDTSQLPTPGETQDRLPRLPEGTARSLPPAPADTAEPTGTDREVHRGHPTGASTEPPPVLGSELRGRGRRSSDLIPRAPQPKIGGGHVRSSYEGSAIVLHLRGKITIGAGEIELRGAIQEALKAGLKRIVLDLAEVSSMDSSGVGELVSSYTTVSNQGGHLVLTRPPAKVRDILTVTQLITVFEVFDSLEAALESLEEGAS